MFPPPLSRGLAGGRRRRTGGGGLLFVGGCSVRPRKGLRPAAGGRRGRGSEERVGAGRLRGAGRREGGGRQEEMVGGGSGSAAQRRDNCKHAAVGGVGVAVVRAGWRGKGVALVAERGAATPTPCSLDHAGSQFFYTVVAGVPPRRSRSPSPRATVMTKRAAGPSPPSFPLPSFQSPPFPFSPVLFPYSPHPTP